MRKGRQGVNQKKEKEKKDIELVVSQPVGLLDFLLSHLKNHSRNNIKSLLAYKQVVVDGRVVSQFNFALKPGQTVKVIKSNTRGQEQEKLDILYEDHELIVINKPAGLLSIATDTEKNRTAYHFLTDYVRLTDPTNRIFAVHRLDRDTSGILMVAKNEKIKNALQDNWSELVSKRDYIAIVEGQLKEKSGTIQSWLKKTETLLMYSSERNGDGLHAITHYKVIKETNDFSMLDIRLETGRKNQIRVHMKDIGHSVIGDKKYGATTNPLRRMGLHAYRLELTHPFTNQLMCFEAKIPKGFKTLLK